MYNNKKKIRPRRRFLFSLDFSLIALSLSPARAHFLSLDAFTIGTRHSEMIATSSRISARAPVTAVSAPAKATAAAVSIRRSGNNRSSLVSSLRKLPRRAPRTSQVAARAAAGGKAYICK